MTLGVQRFCACVFVMACTSTAPTTSGTVPPETSGQEQDTAVDVAPSALAVALDHLCIALEQSMQDAELSAAEQADQAANSLTEDEQNRITALRPEGSPIADYAEFIQRASANGAAGFECEALEQVLTAIHQDDASL